jgi:hypothetical protein
MGARFARVASCGQVDGRSPIRGLARARVTRGRLNVAVGTCRLDRRHHPSAAASPWRSVALGAERLVVPSAGEGTTSLSAPNALRHFSIPKNKGGSSPPNRSSTRLPSAVCAKQHGAPWRSAGGVIRQNGSRRRCPGPSQIAPAIWRAPGGERFRAQALRARECSPQGGRPHVHREQSRLIRAADPMSTATHREMPEGRKGGRPHGGATRPARERCAPCPTGTGG